MNAKHLTIVKRVKEKNVFVDNLRYEKSEVKTAVGITLISSVLCLPPELNKPHFVPRPITELLHRTRLLFRRHLSLHIRDISLSPKDQEFLW